MGNNIKELRLAFLLTPQEMAARMGADVSTLERLESGEHDLSIEWIEAVSMALGVPASAVHDPSTDIRAIVTGAGSLPARQAKTCPIATRYAILALVAKFGGLKIADSLDENDLARAVQNFVNYVESETGAEGTADNPNRLSLPLQLIVLTILQSRGVSPAPGLLREMEKAQQAATSLVEAFSGIDHSGGKPAA